MRMNRDSRWGCSRPKANEKVNLQGYDAILIPIFQIPVYLTEDHKNHTKNILKILNYMRLYIHFNLPNEVQHVK
jgi:hypothetical protein